MESGNRCAKNPAEGWEGPRGSGAEDLGGSGDEGLGREDAVGSDEAGDLGVEREEGEEVGEAGEAGEKPEANRVVHGGSGRIRLSYFPGKVG